MFQERIETSSGDVIEGSRFRRCGRDDESKYNSELMRDNS